MSARLRELLVARRRNLAAIAKELAVMKAERLFSLLGYASVTAYAGVELGMGKSKVSELIGIVQGSVELPAIREAFESGRLEWTKAREETREGAVAVSTGMVRAARSDGEVHDLREEENTVKRTIPKKIRRRVLDRDGRRCRVPGCRSMNGLHVHHEDGWREGHDPERMVTICGAHHRIRHDGELRIECVGDGRFRFRLLDGAVLAATGGVLVREPGGVLVREPGGVLVREPNGVLVREPNGVLVRELAGRRVG